MGKKGAKRKTRWRTLSIGTPPGEEDEEDGSQRNGYVKSEQRSPTRYGKDSTQRNGYHNHQQQQQQQQQQQHHHHHHHHHHGSNHQPQSWLKSRHGSAGSSSNGGSSSGYASGESRNVAFNEDEYTKITTPRQDMLFKKGYLSQRKQLYASTSATPSTTESQSASHSTADGSEAAEDQQLLDSVAATDYLPGGGGAATVLEAAPISYGTYYDHASGYYYECPMMLVGPALSPDQMHHVPCAAVPCAPVPLRPIEWVNPAFVPKLASQQYCYMDYQAQGPDCAALVDAQGMPLGAELSLTNGLSNETSLTGSASVSASGSVADDVDESCNALPIADQEMTELAAQQQQQQAAPPVVPLEVVDQPEVVALPVEAAPYVEPQPMPYLYPGQYMFGPPLVNVNGVTIQSGPMLRCSDMLASSTAAAAAAAAKRRKKKKKKKQKRPHALGNTEDDDEEDYSSEGDTTLSSLSRVPWPPTESTTKTTTSWPLNPECQEFHLPQANAFVESSEPQQQQQQQQHQQLSNEDKRLSNDDEENRTVEEEGGEEMLEEESIKPKTRRRSLKIVREPTPGPELCDVTAEERHDDEEEADDEVNEVEDDDERPIEQVTAMLATASIIETPRKDGDVDASGWQNESSITSESCCAASRTADETDSGFESQSIGAVAAVAGAAAAAAAAASAATAEAGSSKSRPITDAVNEWLKRANSPDLFITSSATSDDDDDDDDDEQEEDDGNDQSKNLQGNPMPALSVNGQASHGQLASSNAQSSCKHREKKTKLRRKCGKQDLAQETLSISVRASDDPPDAAASELTVKDSDAGMRVAEKARINHEDTASMQPVKTYEKGEIVVSMDGELLLVESVTARRNSSSSSSSSSSCASVEASLGSIEEPDLVLECWEPETVEPIVTPKKMLDDDSTSLTAEPEGQEEGNRESMGHVQRYYRLIEDEVTEPAKVVPNSSGEESSDEDHVVEVVVPVITPDKCISYDPRLPVDEAFEVYESCYNASGKSLPYEFRSPFYHGDSAEGPIPCKANCCNIQ